jgi:hypothetical protein
VGKQWQTTPKNLPRMQHTRAIRLLTKIAKSGVDSRIVLWLWEFLLERTQRVWVGGQLSEEVRVTSGVQQGSVLGPLLFLA